MASRFWVGGTGNWDATTTTHWASTTGGAGGASVPTSADTVTFDANSGGGTVTVTADVNVQSISCGAFTGTLDFAAANVTLSTSANAFNNSGSGVRTIKLGSGTWNFTSTGQNATRFIGTTTNLTWDGGTAHLIFAAPAGGNVIFNPGNLTFYHVEFLANSSGAGNFQISSSCTFTTLTINAPNNLVLLSVQTQTVTNLNIVGSSGSAPVVIQNSATTTQSTISKASGSVSLLWTALYHLAFTGGATFVAPKSFDLGGNSGITITPPSGGILSA